MHTKSNKTQQNSREATRKWRKYKKATTDSNLNDQTLPQTKTNSPVMHKQSLGKALNDLPGSPLKKNVKKLTESMGVIAKTTKARNTSTLHYIVDQVQTFYKQEDIASFMSRKQETVTICDENEKRKEQKKF